MSQNKPISEYCITEILPEPLSEHYASEQKPPYWVVMTVMIVDHFVDFEEIQPKKRQLKIIIRYDYNLMIMKSPKPATDNRFKK